MNTIEDVLTKISKFSLVDKEIISDILKKRLIEERRNEIFKNYQESMQNYKVGAVEAGNVEDLFREI
jgi:hypothetical protein